MRFYLVDVFSENKYQGNQLAVFISENNLSAIEMQKIVREVNFSETTFIVSDKKSDLGYDVRIFTPDVEIPSLGLFPMKTLLLPIVYLVLCIMMMGAFKLVSKEEKIHDKS